MTRNDRRTGARRFASPRFALASPRRCNAPNSNTLNSNANSVVEILARQVVWYNVLHFLHFYTAIKNPTAVYGSAFQLFNRTFKPSNFQTSLSTIQSNFQTFKPSNLQTSLSTIQPFNFSTAFYTHDGNKNVSEVIVAGSCVAAHYEYAPFGAVTVSNGAEQNSGSPASIHCSLLPIRCLNPWRFSSEFADDELGCDYFNYREYEPVRGRWLAFDLAGENWTCNLYSFNDNAPICLFDLLGLKRRRCEFIVYAGHYDYVTNKIAIANNDILEHHNSSDRKWYGAVSCFSDCSNAQIEQSGNLALIPGMPSNRDLLYFYEKYAKDTHGVYSRDAMESALEAAVKAAKQLCICGTCDKVSIFFICDEEMESVEKKNILLHGRPSWQKQNPGKKPLRLCGTNKAVSCDKVRRRR